MIDRKTEPVFGVERRLRVSPHISSLPGRQGMSCMGRLHKSRKDYSIMHIKAFKLPDKNPLFYPKNRVLEEDYTGYRRSTMPYPYPSGIRHGSTHVLPGTVIWPDPPDRNGFHNHTDPGGNVSEQLLNGRAPAVHISNKFHNKKNRPFLTRLADDPIGKEADGETTIGEQNNVTKYIN